MMLARLFSKIYKKNGIILIDSEGQKYICGKPDLNKPIIVKLLNKNLNWKCQICGYKHNKRDDCNCVNC